jgi:hypothetical protein
LAASSIAASIGVAAVAALLKSQNQTVQSKQTYLKKIKEAMEKPFAPRHRRALEKLPVFNRGDHDDLKKILTTGKYLGKVVLIQAPAGAGKTTVIDSMLAGRQRVITIPLSEKVIGQRDAGVRILNDVLDCRISETLIPQVNFNTLLGYWEEVIISYNAKLKSGKGDGSDGAAPPLLWIDDVQRGLDPKTGRFYPEFDSFLTWSATMADRMVVVITGSPPIETTLRSVPGIASILVSHQLPSLESKGTDVSRALQEKYHLSAEQTETVLAVRLLIDIGSIFRVAYTCAYVCRNLVCHWRILETFCAPKWTVCLSRRRSSKLLPRDTVISSMHSSENHVLLT